MTSPQTPIGSGFGARSTAREVLAGHDLNGNIAVVTGGYSGIGVETTRALTEAGATVVVPVRTPDKARAALAGIPRVELDAMDLGDPASIDGFAARFVASGRPIHMLIDSAGIMAVPLARDARGFESQLATNHIGHFQLAARLWPALVAAGGARVVSVSSRGHRRCGVDFEDPHFRNRPYEKFVAYGQSKTANCLFALALDRRGEASKVRAFSVHPGAILTDLVRHLTDEELAAFGVKDRHDPNPVEGFKDVYQGAATQVWCATSPKLDGMGGVYCEDVEVAVAVPADDPGQAGVRPWAMDPGAAERLWTLSEAWIGGRFEA